MKKGCASVKRFLSWVVLLISYVLVNYLARLIFALALWLVSWVFGFKLVVVIILFIVFGSLFLSIVVAPLFYGPALVLSASEAICPSKKGTRYRVISCFYLIGWALVLLAYIFLKPLFIGLSAGDYVACIYAMLFSLVFLVQSKHVGE